MKKKILLVDDEVDVISIMGERITSWGYELLTANNGQQALEVIKAEKPDAIILDYLMPDMDGIETLKRIRNLDKDIPVIMFTAHPDEKSIKGTEKLGVSAYIPKLSSYSTASSSMEAAFKMIEKQLKR